MPHQMVRPLHDEHPPGCPDILSAWPAELLAMVLRINKHSLESVIEAQGTLDGGRTWRAQLDYVRRGSNATSVHLPRADRWSHWTTICSGASGRAATNCLVAGFQAMRAVVPSENLCKWTSLRVPSRCFTRVSSFTVASSIALCGKSGEWPSGAMASYGHLERQPT